MGTKRVGLARVEALIEQLKRDLDLSGATLSGGAVSGGSVSGVTGLATAVQTVAALGEDKDDAAAIAATAPLVLVTGANGTTGVELPALSAVSAGSIFIIANTVAQILKVYPNQGDKILPLADNQAVTVAASCVLICVAADADKWVGIEGTAISA